MTRQLPPDLEGWIIGYLRGTVLVAEEIDARVSNKEPAEGDFPATLIIVRDDGGPSTGLTTSTRSIGVSVLAGTRRFDAPARDLARLLMSWLADDDLPVQGGRFCPVAAVTDRNGPYTIAESQDRTRAYFTVEYTVVGSLVE